MKSQTSLVAQQTRLKVWADQIRDCQSRPEGMKVEEWCEQHGITKANYYYRLKRVRQACLKHTQNHEPHFIELPVPVTCNDTNSDNRQQHSEPMAVLRGQNSLSLEIYSSATPELLKSLIGAIAYAE